MVDGTTDNLLAQATRQARVLTDTSLSPQQVEAMYQRIVHGEQRKTSRRSLWPWFTVAVASAAAAAAWLFVLPTQQFVTPQCCDTTMLTSVGETQIIGDLPSGSGDVSSEATVITQTKAKIELQVGKRTRMLLNEKSQAKLARNRAIRLSNGSANFWVRPGQEKVVVRVGKNRVVVHGTRFRVVARNDELRAVVTFDGEVSVHDQDKKLKTIRGGESYNPFADALTELDKTDIQPLSSLLNAGSVSWGILQIDSEPPQASVSLNGRPLGTTPMELHRPVGQYTIEIQVEGYEPQKETVDVSVDRKAQRVFHLEEIGAEPEEQEVEELEDPRDDRRFIRLLRKDLSAGECRRLKRRTKRYKPAQAGNLRVQTQLMLGECYLRTGDRESALGHYEQLATSGKRIAEPALFEAAKLLHSLGKTKESAVFLGRYQKRFPKGRFSADVALRLCELRITDQELPAAAACLEKFRSRRRSGLLMERATYLLGVVYEGQVKWADAAKMFRAYLAERDNAPQSEDAAFHLARCLVGGKLKGASTAVRYYLSRYPGGKYVDKVKRLSK